MREEAGSFGCAGVFSVGKKRENLFSFACSGRELENVLDVTVVLLGQKHCSLSSKQGRELLCIQVEKQYIVVLSLT